jgi:peptidoglycan/xylan/chitin deacetylase (PgdA/CDA1 family)
LRSTASSVSSGGVTTARRPARQLVSSSAAGAGEGVSVSLPAENQGLGVSARGVPRLALTFDDGPDPVWTPLLLDMLRRHAARATFFVIAPLAMQAPALLARMLTEGHVVGLHCDEHRRHTECDRAWLERDTDRALHRLDRLGVTPRLWRTPWGDTAPWSDDVAHRRNLRIVGWTVDTHDWRGDRASEMFAATAADLGDGAVVLAHDGIGPGARRGDVRETLAYVELIVAQARDEGLELSPLRA